MLTRMMNHYLNLALVGILVLGAMVLLEIIVR